MPTDSDTGAARPATLRSRVTNGTRTFLPGAHAHSAPARRMRDLMDAYTNDLGGRDAIGEGQRSLVRMAATMAIEMEMLQAELTKGKPIDPEHLVSTGNALIRCLTALGLQHGRPKRHVPLREQIGGGKS